MVSGQRSHSTGFVLRLAGGDALLDVLDATLRSMDAAPPLACTLQVQGHFARLELRAAPGSGAPPRRLRRGWVQLQGLVDGLDRPPTVSVWWQSGHSAHPELLYGVLHEAVAEDAVATVVVHVEAIGGGWQAAAASHVDSGLAPPQAQLPRRPAATTAAASRRAASTAMPASGRTDAEPTPPTSALPGAWAQVVAASQQAAVDQTLQQSYTAFAAPAVAAGPAATSAETVRSPMVRRSSASASVHTVSTSASGPGHVAGSKAQGAQSAPVPPQPRRGDALRHPRFGLCRVERVLPDDDLIVRVPTGARKTLRMGYLQISEVRQEKGQTVHILRTQTRR
ncbi:MAG: hypothetical protein ACPGUV_06340 [Polyangiales bacterium]